MNIKLSLCGAVDGKKNIQDLTAVSFVTLYLIGLF